MEPNRSKFLWVFPIAEITQPTTLTNKQMRNNVPYILKLHYKIFYSQIQTRLSKLIDSVFYKNKYKYKNRILK